MLDLCTIQGLHLCQGTLPCTQASLPTSKNTKQFPATTDAYTQPEETGLSLLMGAGPPMLLICTPSCATGATGATGATAATGATGEIGVC